MKATITISALLLILLFPGCYTQLLTERDVRLAEMKPEEPRVKTEPVTYVYFPQVHLVPIPGWDDQFGDSHSSDTGDESAENLSPDQPAIQESLSSFDIDPSLSDIDQIQNAQFLPTSAIVSRVVSVSTSSGTENSSAIVRSSNVQPAVTPPSSSNVTRNSGTTRRRGR